MTVHEISDENLSGAPRQNRCCLSQYVDRNSPTDTGATSAASHEGSRRASMSGPIGTEARAFLWQAEMFLEIDVDSNGSKQHLGLCVACRCRLVVAGNQPPGRAHDPQAAFERDVAGFVLPKERAPISLTARRMIRICAAAIVLVERARLPEGKRTVADLFNGQSERAHRLDMLGVYRDGRIQRAAAAQAACQA